MNRTLPAPHRSITERFSGCRVAVVGDLMLDIYLWGQASRLSPEAPVPVVGVRRRTSCPGGAANVARNLATLRAKAFVFGATGSDPAGEELKKQLAALGVDTSGVITVAGRPTTQKERIIAGSQQLLRVDTEELRPVDDTIREKLIGPLLEMIRRHEIDAVIFEDYAKGLLSESMLETVIAAARPAGVITALDPKPGNLSPVRGLTVMKPNRSEAFAMAGVVDSPGTGVPERDAALAEVSRKLREAWAPEHLLISLAAQGMALYNGADGAVQVIPTRAREVFDVSGAGDTVTATYTLAMIAGASPALAAEIANRAAGVVVGKVGTAPILYDELIQALNEVR